MPKGHPNPPLNFDCLKTVTGNDLSIAWTRYVELFGTVPHGSVKQMNALLELVPHRMTPKEWEEKYTNLKPLCRNCGKHLAGGFHDMEPNTCNYCGTKN